MNRFVKAYLPAFAALMIAVPALESPAHNREPASASMNKMSFEFSLSGAGGTLPVFPATALMNPHVLRVKLRVMPPAIHSDESLDSAPELAYGCARFTLLLGGHRMQTAMLATGTGAPGCAASEQSFDLSGELKRLRDSSRAPASAPLSLTLAEAETDAFCKASAAGRIFGDAKEFCPAFPAQPSQSVHGVIEVETDGAISE